MRKSHWILAAAVWVLTAAGAYFLGAYQGGKGSLISPGAGSTGRASSPSLLEKGSGLGGGSTQKGQGGSKDGSANRSGAAQQGDVSISEARYSSLPAWFSEVSSLLESGMMNQRNMVRAFQLTQALREEDVPRALEMAEDLPEDQRRFFMVSGILSRMAEYDGPGAVAYLKKQQEKEGPMRSMAGGAIHGVISTWVENDPEAAWKWFEEESKKEPSTSARSPMGAWGDPTSVAAMPLFQQLASDDLSKAFEKLETLSSQQMKNMALQGILSMSMFGGNREEMLAQVEQLEDNSLKQNAYQQVLQSWASSDPAEAVAWYDENAPEDSDGNVRRQLASSWLMREPDKAAEWWWEETPEAQRADVLPQIVSSWGFQDPKAAHEWLNTFDPGPELDPALGSLVHAAARTDPQHALEIAGTITETENRYNAVEQAIRIWSETDRSAALDYLRKESPLPTERLNMLQQQLDPQVSEQSP